MAQNNSAFWDKALRALDKLEEQVGQCPDVNFVDIGYAREGNAPVDVIALRIHVQEQVQQDKFPQVVDGMPVVTIKH